MRHLIMNYGISMHRMNVCWDRRRVQSGGNQIHSVIMALPSRRNYLDSLVNALRLTMNVIQAILGLRMGHASSPMPVESLMMQCWAQTQKGNTNHPSYRHALTTTPSPLDIGRYQALTARAASPTIPSRSHVQSQSVTNRRPSPPVYRGIPILRQPRRT